jgi:hypothetical protein
MYFNAENHFIDSIFFRNEQPLIIAYQNAKQRVRMTTLAKKVVFLDATYKGIIYCDKIVCYVIVMKESIF